MFCVVAVMIVVNSNDYWQKYTHVYYQKDANKT